MEDQQSKDSPASFSYQPREEESEATGQEGYVPFQSYPTHGAQPGQDYTAQTGQANTTQPGKGYTTQPGQAYVMQPGQGFAMQPAQGFAMQPGQGFAMQPGQGLSTQPVQPGMIVVNQVQVQPVPPNYFHLSIFTMLCCNLVFGIIALFFSMQSKQDYARGDSASARSKGRVALILNIVGIVISVVLSTILVIVYFTVFTYSEHTVYV